MLSWERKFLSHFGDGVKLLIGWFLPYLCSSYLKFCHFHLSTFLFHFRKYSNTLMSFWLFSPFFYILWGGRNRTDNILYGRCLNASLSAILLAFQIIGKRCLDIQWPQNMFQFAVMKYVLTYEILNQLSKCLWYLSKILAFGKLTVILTFCREKKTFSGEYRFYTVIFSSYKVNPWHFPVLF